MTDSYVYSMGGPGRASRPSDFTGILMELLVDERVQPGVDLYYSCFEYLNPTH